MTNNGFLSAIAHILDTTRQTLYIGQLSVSCENVFLLKAIKTRWNAHRELVDILTQFTTYTSPQNDAEKKMHERAEAILKKVEAAENDK